MQENLFCFFIFLLVLFSCKNNIKRLNAITIILVSLILSLFVYLLCEHSPDYYAYELAYNFGSLRMEPFFIFLNQFNKGLGLDFKMNLFVIAFISCMVKVFVINKVSPAPFLSILVWVSNLFILQELIAIRAGLAAGFVLSAYYFREKNNLKMIILSSICALGFHITSIAPLAFIFVSNTKQYKLLYYLLIPISYIVGVFMGQSLFPYLNLLNIDSVNVLVEMYENSDNANPFNLLQIARVLICYFLWFNVDKITRSCPIALRFLKMYTIGCCMFPLFFGYVSIAIRFSDLFLVSTIILYPLLKDCFQFKTSFLIPILISVILAYFTTLTFLFN